MLAHRIMETYLEYRRTPAIVFFAAEMMCKQTNFAKQKFERGSGVFSKPLSFAIIVAICVISVQKL
jgi:hypothetical protein